MSTRMKEAATSLKEQLAEYRAGWYGRVPAERQAIIQRHIEQLRSGAIARTMLKASGRAPAIVLGNAKGETLDVGALVKNGPVIVTFYRDGCCPYSNLELKAFQEILPEIAAAGASLVAISSEKPDDTLSTAEKNALTFQVLANGATTATGARDKGVSFKKPNPQAIAPTREQPQNTGVTTRVGPR
jgi:peroxiredoxin